MSKEELEQRVKDQDQFILALADRLYVCYEILSRLAECEIKKRTNPTHGGAKEGLF